MTKKLKNENGITLISLVVTIIVMIILASAATYTGITVIDSANLTSYTTQMKMMQIEVNSLYDKYVNEDTVNINGNDVKITDIGKALDTNANQVITQENTGFDLIDIENYKYFDKETIESLKIDAVEIEFYIDIANRKIVSCKPLEYQGNKYYTLDKLPDSLYNVDYDRGKSGKPKFTATYKSLENGKYQITIPSSSIIYSVGNIEIEKWDVKYKIHSEKSWSVSDNLTFLVATPGIYDIIIKNGEIQSDIYQINIETPTVKIGDYVNYYPSKADKYTILNQYAGFSRNQEIEQEELNWRVLEINDDGDITLISDDAVSDEMLLYGTNGYNNVVFYLNDLANKQYSNLKYGKARSINISDIEKYLTYDYKSYSTPYYRYGEIKKFVNTGVLQSFHKETGTNFQIPNIFKKEVNSKIEDISEVGNLNQNQQERLEEGEENTLVDITAQMNYWTKKFQKEDFQKEIYYDLLVENTETKRSHFYSFASRVIGCSDIYFFFGLEVMASKSIECNAEVSNIISKQAPSSVGAESYSIKLRPIVTLNPGIKIRIDNNKDGKTPDTAWNLE